MATNKVVYGGRTLIDLTTDTVSKDKVLSGFTFHAISGEVETGECDYDVNSSDGTVQVAEMLINKTAYARGVKLTGTMPNRGKVTGTISTKTGTYQVPQGYHDGTGTVGISTTEQSKIVAGNIKNGVTILGVEGNYSGESIEVPQPNKDVIPSDSQQIITPDSGYTCLMQVTVKPIPYTETANAYGTTVTIG